jgi:hypothetical protein
MSSYSAEEVSANASIREFCPRFTTYPWPRLFHVKCKNFSIQPVGNHGRGAVDRGALAIAWTTSDARTHGGGILPCSTI